MISGLVEIILHTGTRFKNLFACIFDYFKASKLNYFFFAIQLVSLIIQIILSPNLAFNLPIHLDSKLLHYLFKCTANSYCFILLYIILGSALFDISIPPVSAINYRLDSLCIRKHTPPY